VADDPGAVLITGCSTGIGRATAERLAQHGHRVWATARHVDAIADLESAGCRLLALDVTDEASMRAAVETVVREDGAVGALVNNAGYSQSGAIESVPMEDVRRQFETNVFGLVRMCQLVLPSMRERGAGRIVNVSSMGGKLVFPGGGLYHATKFAVEALSDALRFEVAGFGVQVVVIEPGAIRTNFDQAAVGALPADGGGAYTSFNAAVGAATKQAYEAGPMKLLGAGPEAVARTIERALIARRPRTRYRVTPSAHLLMRQRALMSDRMWDRFVGTQFPRPGGE
jgi:NAD(P)-dependent dehydrogenase (short-subunit alcohol dehydrogenase family)